MADQGLIKLRYGNTNTFLVRGSAGSLLVDTDYAGTLRGLFTELKRNSLQLSDISFILATHYHPDHIGLVSELMERGVRLLLIDVQLSYVHYSDRIFQRDGLKAAPIREDQAVVISCAESRGYLETLGIFGEIVPTPSHSPDSVSLILDDGICLAGDLEPYEYLAAYESGGSAASDEAGRAGSHAQALRKDWDLIKSFRPKTIYYAHADHQRYSFI